MKALKVTMGLLIFCSSAFSQKKDTATVDTLAINTISIKDLYQTLTYLEDKVTKKEYDNVVKYFNVLIQLTEEKRKKIVTNK